MAHLARAFAAAPLVLVHLSCSPPDAAHTAGDTVSLAMQEGHVDAGDGVRLFYRIVGAAPDTVIVLHGGPGFTLDYFADDLAPLAERHTLLFYDQRGAGNSSLVSDSSALDAQRFADDVEAIRRHFGMERVALLGHSWGAGVAALYAIRHPERISRLLIVGGLPLTLTGIAEAFEALAASRDTAESRLLREAMDARSADPTSWDACRAYYVLWFRPFFHDSAAAGRSKGDFCAGTAESRTNKMASVDRYVIASLGDWDWRPGLSTLEAPALIIHGTGDPIAIETAREWASTLPNARLLVLQDVGHFSYVEAPEQFFPAADAFLSGEWPDDAEPVALP